MMKDDSSPAASDSPTLTTISDDPSVKESLITTLDSPITPTERFYVRNHFSEVPEINAASWRLKIGGLVNQPLELSLEELQSLPSRESVVTLECAGNSPLLPDAGGGGHWVRPRRGEHGPVEGRPPRGGSGEGGRV